MEEDTAKAATTLTPSSSSIHVGAQNRADQKNLTKGKITSNTQSYNNSIDSLFSSSASFSLGSGKTRP